MAFEGHAAVDGFGRRFRYLRLSVTEVCNFRCTYCLPDGFKKTGPMSYLDVDEIGRLVGAFADLGLGKVRLTGGEPTVRRDFTDIVARVAAQPGVGKVAVTTNGWNLVRHVDRWRAAGLSHLNVSIDSLERETFARITGHDRLPMVLDGIEAALDAGYQAVKVNAVLLKETAEAGFQAWADFVRDRPGLAGEEVIRAIKWNVPYPTWEEISFVQRWCIVTEGVVILNHLVGSGAIRREKDESGINRYF